MCLRPSRGGSISGTTRPRSSPRWRRRRFAGGSYEAIAWSPDGSKSRLLASKPNAGSYIAYVWFFDPATGRSGVKAQATSAGCQDLAWATDAFSQPAVAVTCGVNGVTLFHIDSGNNFVNFNGNAGNTSRISARPQGDYALAIEWSDARVNRYQQGNWTTGFSQPNLPTSFQVEFSTDGNRALILGGYAGAPAVGKLYEFRHDLMQQADFIEVSIPNFALPPYNADGGVELNDAAWRPGCEGRIDRRRREHLPDEEGLRHPVLRRQRHCLSELTPSCGYKACARAALGVELPAANIGKAVNLAGI